MLNQVVLVGRLVQTPEVTTTESGKSMTYITVAVPRSFKNAEGEYDTDFVDCVLWQAVAENTAEYCKKGDIIGTKSKRYTLYKPLFIRYRNRVIVFIIDNPIK
jgi:single-strand DNA-binding protein